MAKAHPEWLVPGQPIDYFGATGLCLCLPAAREWLTEQVSRPYHPLTHALKRINEGRKGRNGYSVPELSFTTVCCIVGGKQMISLIDSQGLDYIVQDGEDLLKHCPGVCPDDNFAASVVCLCLSVWLSPLPILFLNLCECGQNCNPLPQSFLLSSGEAGA